MLPNGQMVAPHVLPNGRPHSVIVGQPVPMPKPAVYGGSLRGNRTGAKCECPMCYHSIKNPCASCGCPSSSVSKASNMAPNKPRANNGHVFKDAQSSAAFFLSPSSDYYSLSPDSPPPTTDGGDSPKTNLSLESQESDRTASTSPGKKSTNNINTTAGIQIENLYQDANITETETNSSQDQSDTPANTSSEERETTVDRQKRDTKVPPKIAKKPVFPPLTEKERNDRRHSWAGKTPTANRPTTLHDFKKLLSQQPLAGNSHRKSAQEQLLAQSHAEHSSHTPPPPVFNDGNHIGGGGSLRKRNGWAPGGQRFSVIQEESELRKSQENLLD